jgi:hypothetical protein
VQPIKPPNTTDCPNKRADQAGDFKVPHIVTANEFYTFQLPIGNPLEL